MSHYVVIFIKTHTGAQIEETHIYLQRLASASTNCYRSIIFCKVWKPTGGILTSDFSLLTYELGRVIFGANPKQ